MKKPVLFLWSLFLLVTAGNAQTPRFVSDSLENYIKTGMKDWQIPGLAIAIVKDGQVVYMKGYGESDMATHEKVDENTLFMIASNSKLFTGTSLAQLEYNKKLSLNDKITRYFPDFRLYDNNATEMVTIKDMLSHHLGTKTFQGDFTFWNGNLSRSQIIQRMRTLKPEGQFRQDFGYCNSCFLTAGEIIPKVSGKPWEVYVYDSILMPLGMKNTHMLTTGIAQRPNVSRPYSTSFTGQLHELPYDQVDNLGPAGSMISNVKDMAKWLLLQLDSGRYEGQRIIPWQVIRRTRDMVTTISSRKNRVYPSHYAGYGLGIFMTDYNGKQVFWHTGGAFGFVTNTCFVPEEKLGITILTNNDNQDFFEALRYQVLDAYLGVAYVNRSLQLLPAHLKETQQAVKELAALKERVKGNAAALPVSAYTGEYGNEIYGTISIKARGNDLFIKFNSHNNLTATLQYMDKDEWLLEYSNAAFGIFPVKFKTEHGKILSVDIKASDFVEFDSYLFTKK
ncbi:MAG: serine hydrolase [Bacteroidetes bacterium]|nr:serine hydrolase [Bacteroidota bacterium]